MTPSSSDESLIARLLALPVAERAAELERARADDPAIGERLPEIKAVLTAAEFSPREDAGGHLSPAAMVLVLNAALDVAPSEVPGTRIGPYKLLQEIGRGGFGVVWMVEQEQPMRRRVALKIIKAGMDTKEVIARFEAERQALALMDHANIARVYDAGATEAGRPYFAMELVRGVAITRYCDDNRLPAAERLQLFIVVCQAVQHAHQKGVIHRDLKPSNILVTMHDGVPVPKIIDFGIAKATGGARLTDKTLFTQFHAFIGTPAYTSPEQMEMSGLDVDTRSDIYSLGVLLYELLAGRQPFDADALIKSGLDAMRRTIREIDPPRPSHRLTTLTDAERTSVAQQRGTDAGKLSVLLRGDLDWIVMRCMEKDRAHRYETANGLAMDIQRYLASEPVVARPPSSVYRLQKFIRRHKLSFAAATAVAASVVAGLIASSVLLVRERAAHAHAVQAELAESRLRQQADIAREQATKNASRTALDLVGQLLAKGQTADALAYLVYAAQKDPANTAIAPRLASVLTSHNFLLPEGAPFQCGSRVLAVHYTVDGRLIYIGTEDGTFRIIDAASGELRREIRLGKNVRRKGWAFADKNEEVFGVSFVDNAIGLFEVKTGRPVWPLIQLDKATAFHWSAGLEFSPDARWLCAHGETSFWVWDAATGQECFKQSFPVYYNGPCFTRDGTHLTCGSADTVQVWSLPDGQPAFAPIRFPDKFLSYAGLSSEFSPDGQFLLVFDLEDIHVFDARTGKLLWSKRDPNGSDGFLPDGRMIAIGPKSWDYLDLTTGIATSLPGEATPNFGDETASADGKFLLTASNDGYPRLWETTTGRLVAEATLQQQDGFHAAPSPDGAQVVLGTADGAILRLRVGRGAARPLVLYTCLNPHALPNSLLDGKPARLRWFKADRAVVLDVASGREVAGGFVYPAADLPELYLPNTYLQPMDQEFFVLQDWTAHRPSVVWEHTESGIRRVGTLQGDEGALPGSGYWKIAFSPTGDLFARARGLNEIGIWNLHTGAPVGPGCTYENKQLCQVGMMGFSPDGKHLAAGTMDGKGLVWDVATGKITTVLPLQSDTFCAFIQFSPDGKRLLTVDSLKHARLWNPGTGEPCSAPLNVGNPYNQTGFSPDGRWIFTSDDTGIQILDGKNGALVSEPSHKAGWVQFSRDGERIAFNEGDEVRVCEVRTAQSLTEPTHLPGLAVVGWSPDDRFLQIGGGDHLIRILSVPPLLRQGTPVPPWLLQLAAICATKKVNDAGQCVNAPEIVTQIGDVRRQLAALPDDAPYVEWGRWILDDSPTRSIAPGFTITPAEADKLAAEGAQPATPSEH